MDNRTEKNYLNLRITQGRDIPQNLVKQILLSIVELEKRIYKSSLQGNIELYFDWYKKNPDILTILTSDKLSDVIGSFIFMPIDEFAYQKLKNGLWTDLNVGSEHVVSYENHGFYFLCLNTVLIDKKRVNGIVPLTLIINALFKKMFELAERNIIIQNLITDVVTDEGARLAGALGMKSEENKHFPGYSIYTMTLWPPQDIARPLFFTSQTHLINKYKYLWEKTQHDKA